MNLVTQQKKDLNLEVLVSAMIAKEMKESKKPYKLVARDNKEEFYDNYNNVVFKVKDVIVGDNKPLIIAGPCTVHSRDQTIGIAKDVKAAGVDMLRGGAFKPRTSPYSFQGLGEDGLNILKEASEITNLPIVTEVTSIDNIDLVGKYADVLQIGARNSQNYPLLQKVGKYAAEHDKAILLKNGFSTTPKETLLCAEYLANEGAKKIILCERGTRINTFEEKSQPNYKFLDILKKECILPVIGDPSHSTKDINKVIETSDNYLKTGANGLIVEVRRNNEPEYIDGIKVCDYSQSITTDMFKEYMSKLKEK